MIADSTPQRRRPGVWRGTDGFDVSLFAPEARAATLHLADGERVVPLERQPDGYHTVRGLDLRAGQLYRFKTDRHDSPMPDPASLSQPQGVHGASAVVDVATFAPDTTAWRGHPLEDMILYELHVGTFSAAGTFDGAIEHLDALVELGVNAIELMPVNAFPGERNWGYDGVYWQAAQASYGGIAGLRRLVVAAHERGLAVIIDAVFNHLGPEGNYLGTYATYLNEQKRTPWGPALNADGPYSDGVRDLVLSVAETWLVDVGADGLRLDAVHAILDSSATHLLAELSDRVAAYGRAADRTYVLIAECDLNDPRYTRPTAAGGLGMSGQWVDEFHHSVRTFLTEDKTGYYGDFGSVDHVYRALRDAYVYTGQYSEHRKRRFGRRPSGAAVHQFVVFGQNHDQVGNRALGERLHEHLTAGEYLLVAGMYLWSPFTPMLWMGEEYRETAPFPYFVSHTDEDILDATRKGRAREFAAFLGDGEHVPDPGAKQTFRSAKLSHDRQGAVYEFYRKAIQTRKAVFPTRLRGLDDHTVTLLDDEVLTWRMPREDGSAITVVANLGKGPFELSDHDATAGLSAAQRRCSSAPITSAQLPARSIALWLEA